MRADAPRRVRSLQIDPIRRCGGNLSMAPVVVASCSLAIWAVGEMGVRVGGDGEETWWWLKRERKYHRRRDRLSVSAGQAPVSWKFRFDTHRYQTGTAEARIQNP